MAVDMEAVAKLLDDKLAEQTRLLKLEFNKAIEFMSAEIQELKNENKKIKKNYKDLADEHEKVKIEVLVIKSELRDSRFRAIRQEQYTRKNNIKIYGMDITDQETPDNCKQKVVDMCKDKLNLIIPRESMVEAHPLPRGKKTSMIVKFSNYSFKTSVISARKALKGTKTSINEDMSEDIIQQIKDIEAHPKVTSAWMWHQKINIIDSDNKFHKFPCGQPTPRNFQI